MATLLSTIILCKCPRCRQGKLFKPRWSFTFWDFGIMQERCNVCDLNFKPEPGFYFGASYTSYAFGVALSGITWFVMWYFGIDETWRLLTTITALIILFSPYNFKISRSSWLAMFVRYKPDWANQKNNAS
jgi:uncharacterized protein (DUF983 family)